MAEEYTAEPAVIQAGVRQIDAISESVGDAVKQFWSDVNTTAGWFGVNDSFAKEIKPQETQEREGSIKTAQSLADAILAVSNGTTANLKNIKNTQEGNLAAIQQSAGKRSNGRH
ncbi:hypothetical protein [Streptomyces sp. ISID311]|uniref:hypothetical protein n=1 Tax=Streptomyces sp. ISID311 TaxID=2601673 RepID=UPI0011BD36FD|nr:hypothetical protein [Streptomyces sp. ISID311]TXC99889.1 hypothetical protein FS847_01080 [Streptomyces sp. ISID311]